MNSKKLKNKRNSSRFLLIIFLVTFFVACNQEKTVKEFENRTSLIFDHKDDLPKIGQHDVIGTDTTFHTVPDWIFLNEDSVSFSSDEINDKLWIANFFFSYCPTICRPMNLEMKEINTLLKEYEDDLAFLSFSIDERRDVPSRLREYKEILGIDSKNWTFIAGDQIEIQDLAIHGFQILAQEDDSAPGGFIHSSSLVLVDTDRHIRGIYETQNPADRDRLIHDVKLFLDN